MRKLHYTLLVDDDKIANFIAEKLIKKMNITEEIQIAANGEEALHLLKERQQKNLNHPELIFLDINMPIMDGFEFLKHYVSLGYPNHGRTRIVMLTSSNSPKDIQDLEEKGIKDFMDKPISAEKIRRILEAT